MGRFRTGFRLAGQSWRLLLQDRQLMWLPLVGAVFTMISAAVVGGGAFLLANGAGAHDQTAGYIAAIPTYFVLSFVTILFNSAVVAGGFELLHGNHPTAGECVSMAWAKRGRIARWAAVAATVGLILRAIEDRSSLLGRIVAGLIGVAWSILTFFMVPIILMEDGGIKDSIARSGHLVKERWGEGFAGSAAIGLGVMLAALGGLVVALLAGVIFLPLGIAIGIVVIIAAIAVSGALSGVFMSALYLYATTGQAPQGFDQSDLAAAFQPKRTRGSLN